MPSQTAATHPSRTTPRFTLVLLWILASAYTYGFGISELNPLQPILTCQLNHTSSQATLPSLAHPPSGCIPLTESQFGLITSLFTLGGLASSLSISAIANSRGWGRRTSITLSAFFGLVGSIVLTSARSVAPLAIGRLFQGLGSGIGVVVVPIYINEISPASLQGSNGVLNQLSIVVGIFTAQALGASPLGSDGNTWRWIPATSALISATQLLAGFVVAVESPGWLQGEGRKSGSDQQADEVRRLLWSAKELDAHREDTGRRTAPSGAEAEADADADVDERQGLLADGSGSGQHSAHSSVSLREIFTDPAIRPGTLMVVFTQLAQQLSGVNAVLYYSTGILSTILPSLAGSIGILITVINMLMTFPPILLISEDRLGRRNLMVLSAAVMSVSSLLLGVAIVYDIAILSAVCIVVMVAGFSVGLGPIPFVILPELVPSRAVSTTTSLGLSLNWSGNFLIGAAFLPLKNFLAGFDHRHTGGAVFWLFTLSNAVTALVVARFYRYAPPQSSQR
ncbi:uncharacterized protein PFL1_03605 [Pseudozyma flocculosa PF-1]|uniref:Related to VPS73 - protein involved in vacuolar protein sorting n=2 Tax=Pseudozyma flocculosa TaxID=84751 RepID=A0A5C3F7M8_9BASI|nr:uncharacterized protein PFL1_03605 [Pseudozyma flocculosa PF-1]EPQ28802.1 hypothetical protein PFL1_03605 [Pseudozyma flocculosa PF-1]SPO39409.1 related to VPS73 - protein involved in vacuolar protein sorting [Pseudozyma flocculosa]